MESMDNGILIIGGGLGGLCLAQGLLKAGISFRIFERDASADWRAQGYRLRLNGDGANALKETLPAGLWERFQNTCCSAELGETDINAVDGAIIASRAGGSPAMKGLKPYTCDRTVLRGILLDGLEGTVSYGKELVRYENVAGGIIAYFKDGTTASGRFLVGADGRGSVTRRQFLPDHLPLDTEGTCIYGKTPITPELLERFPSRAMRWMTLVIDRTPLTQTLDVDDTAVTLLLEPIRFSKRNDQYDQYMPPDYMYWVLVARKQVFDLPSEVPFSAYTGDEIAAISLRIADLLGPQPPIDLALAGQDTVQLAENPISGSIHEGLGAIRQGYGDWRCLSHDEPEWRGRCACKQVTALVDGANLAKTIATKGISTESIGDFEQAMRQFAAGNIHRSYNGGRKMFGQKPFNQCTPYLLKALQMDSLDQILKAQVDGESPVLHNACYLVVSNDVYSKAHGSADLARTKPISLDSLHWIASLTKLSTAVATLIAVDQGLVTLDDDVRKIVPELAELDVLEGFDDDGKPRLRPCTAPISLRSGFCYDQHHEGLKRWASYVGKKETTFTGSMEGYRYPLVFEPGQGWAYGSGMDWAGRTIEVVAKQDLESFMKTNIWTPLGMRSTTFRPWTRPDLEASLVELAWRNPDGALVKGKNPFGPAVDCCGGVGLFSTPHDHDQAPVQPATGRRRHLKQRGDRRIATPADRGFVALLGSQGDFGLSSSINATGFPGRRAANSANWQGMPGVHAWLDRATGLAGVFTTQLLPPGDKVVTDTFCALEEAVYKGTDRGIKLRDSEMPAYQLTELVPTYCAYLLCLPT
ncbi:hypothetical protein CIB48_g3325 [Xylaria polymorpha]|nr:hypothetical protein CIB48_g3325 [Xylaria polymorpha]